MEKASLGLTRRDFIKVSAALGGRLLLPDGLTSQSPHSDEQPRDSELEFSKLTVVKDQVVGLATMGYEYADYERDDKFFLSGKFNELNQLEISTTRKLPDFTHDIAFDPNNPDRLAIHRYSEVRRGRNERVLMQLLSSDGGATFREVSERVSGEDVGLFRSQFTSDGKYLISFYEDNRSLPGSLKAPSYTVFNHSRIVEFDTGSVVISTPSRGSIDFSNIDSPLYKISDGTYIGYGTPSDGRGSPGYKKIIFDPEYMRIRTLTEAISERGIYINILSSFIDSPLESEISDQESHRLWASTYNNVRGTGEEFMELQPATNRILRRIGINRGLYRLNRGDYVLIDSVVRDKYSGSSYVSTLRRSEGPEILVHNIEYAPSTGNGSMNEHQLIPKDGVLRKEEMIHPLSILYKGSERFLIATTMLGTHRTLYRRVTDGINSPDSWQEARLSLN